MSLKKQVTKGFFWVAIERFGQQFLQGVLFVVLARLLSPEDFGLIAILTVFFAISQTFINSGMAQALIRQKEITIEDRSTVFWFNLLVSLLFYTLIYFTAPYIALFYDEPELISLMRVMGLSIIFYGFSIIQTAELTQQLRFKKQAYAQVPAMLVSGIISVYLAYNGYGVWALVMQYLLISFFRTLFLWIIQPTRLLFLWDSNSFHSLFGFGYKLLLSALLDTIYTNIYKLIIGKFFTINILGFYAQAKRIQELVSISVSEVIGTVTYPILSKVSDDSNRLKQAYRRIIQGSSFLIFPGMGLMIILAEPILVYILGKQWAPATPFLQIICLSGMLYHLHAINLNVLKVLGRSDLFLKLEIIKKTNITIAIIIGLQFGIYGLLIGQVVSSYIALIINTYYTSKFIDYSIGEQVKDVLKVLFPSIPMIIILSILQRFLTIDSFVLLVTYGFIAMVLYLLSNIMLKTPFLAMVSDLVAPYLPGKLKKLYR